MKQLLVSIALWFTYTSASAYVSQSNWRWRNNDGSESAATWRADEKQPITIGTIDSVLRLRIQFQNTTGQDKGINYNLQYASAPDGPWRYITNFKGNNAFKFSSVVTPVSDLAPTTQQLTGASNTFEPGRVLVATNELNRTIANSTATEYEYSLQATDNIEANTTYYFKVPNTDISGSLPTLKTTAAIAAKPGLVTNGSFEDGLNNWTFRVATGAVGTESLVDSVHKQGVKSLVVRVNSTGTGVSHTHSGSALQVGKIYMVRFWAMAKNNSAKMQLQVKGSSKNLIYNYKLYTRWQEYQFAFKAFEPSVALSFLYQTVTQYTIDKVELLAEDNEEVDVAMNYMWQNKRSPGQYHWLSADGNLSEKLPDGRTVWTFSDGWFGYNDTTTNSMQTHQLLRNCLVVQDAPAPQGNLTTIIGGTPAAPKSLMNPPDPQGHDNFFWPRDMIVENDSLKVLLPDVRQPKPNDPLVYGKREAVAVFSLPDLTLHSIKYLPFIDTMQYNTLFKADDGYTYAYSKIDYNSFESHAIVARYPNGKLSPGTPWQYYTDTGWSYNDRNYKEIADVELYTITKLGPNNYVALFLTPLSDKVEVEFAQSPVGPWVHRSIVGQIEGQADIMAYFGVLHEETANNGVYTFSYSNIGEISHMLDDKTVYWPTYLRGDLKSLSPFTDQVLPVTMLQFTAKPYDNRVLLQWHTASEHNNSHFVVERSSDGHKWLPIATEKASFSNTYQVYDEKPFNGKNYYRLQQVDTDGKTTPSIIRLVTMQAQKAVVNFYPNPTSSGINFTVSNYSGGVVTATLSNANGSVVHKEIVTVNGLANAYALQLQSKLPPGVYVLQLAGNNVNETARIVVK